MNAVVMNTDRLDDDSVVVNFDMHDDGGDAIKQNGYVYVQQKEDMFIVIVYNAEGDAISETHLPFDFKEC
jgi:hypothetical protein